MIAARKNRGFCALFSRHARTRIAGTFGHVRVSGVDEIRRALEEGPVLVVANHTAWWDPLVALWLTNLVFESDAFAMMDATNLRRLPFFGLVGAFGVDLRDPDDGARAIRYAARLLDRPRRLVWVYPEGRERPPFLPLELKPGAALVGRVAKRAKLVCIGVRYVFGSGERPDAWIAIGPPQASSRDIDAAVMVQRDGIAAELARIDHALATGADHGFVVLSQVKPSALASLAERLLAWLAKFL